MAARLTGSITTLGWRAKANSARVAHGVVLKAVNEVVDSARAQWPRDTGRSAALLGVETRGDDVVAVGRAEYTLQIVSDGMHPWRDLVVTPLNLRLRDINEEIGAGVIAALRVD